MRMVTLTAAAALFCISPAAMAAETLIIDVTGPESSTSPAFTGGGGALVEFTIASDLVNPAFYADIVCVSCDGIAFLLTDFGPTSDLSDVFFLGGFDGSSDPIFSLSSLEAGTYYLFLATMDGGLGWRSTQSPTFTLAPGAIVGSSLITDWFDANVPFTSSFALLTGQDLLFRITSEADAVPAVPEPATWLMMLTGFGFAGVVLRRRGRSTELCRSC